MAFRLPWGGVIAVCMFAIATLSLPAFAQGLFDFTPSPRKPPAPETLVAPTPPPPSPEMIAARRANEWTVGLAGGSLNGTFLQVAADIAQVVDDGENLRAVGMLTKGSTQNVYSLLFVPNVDVAVVSADTFGHIRREGKVANLEKRVQYIAQLYVNSLQVLARPEITTLADLNGKKVAIAAEGTTAANLAARVLERNGIKAQVFPIGWSEGINRVKSGEFAAVFATFVKGEQTLYSTINDPNGMHLLSIPIDEFADEYYVPVALNYDDYHKLIAPGEVVQTFGSPVVLAVQNYTKKHANFTKVARFIDRFFENYTKLKTPPHYPVFKHIDVAGKVPGWQRYWYAESVLKKHLASQVATTSSVSSIPTSALNKRDERLFREFLEWKNSQIKQ